MINVDQRRKNISLHTKTQHYTNFSFFSITTLDSFVFNVYKYTVPQKCCIIHSAWRRKAVDYLQCLWTADYGSRLPEYSFQAAGILCWLLQTFCPPLFLLIKSLAIVIFRDKCYCYYCIIEFNCLIIRNWP